MSPAVGSPIIPEKSCGSDIRQSPAALDNSPAGFTSLIALRLPFIAGDPDVFGDIYAQEDGPGPASALIAPKSAVLVVHAGNPC